MSVLVYYNSDMKVPRKNREPFSFNYRFSTKVAILNEENLTSCFYYFFLSCRSLEKEEIKMWEYSPWCFVLEFLYVAFSKISFFCHEHGDFTGLKC